MKDNLENNTNINLSGLNICNQIENGLYVIDSVIVKADEDIANVIFPEGVTGIGDKAFASCDNLTTVVIPEGVISIGFGAFFGCENLNSITIPASVTSIGDSIFEECFNLEEIIYL